MKQDKGHYGGNFEKEVAEALQKAGIKYLIPERLDFYLPERDMYIEVKEYHTDRVNDQLASQENVILLQGRKAVMLFCALLTRAATDY